MLEPADFSGPAGARRAYTLTQNNPTTSVTFSIVNDQTLEGRESFTATVDSDDQQVTVTVPTTEVAILDEDSTQYY